MLEESCPIEVFATELQRRIQEGTGDAQKDLQTLPCLNEEAPIAEAMARSKGMWVDLHPRNVLRDSDGDLYVIDADFRLLMKRED